MKYIIMCGGNYSDKFETPKQLLKVNGEILVERTIRLLKENGIKDIAITTNDSRFNYLDVEIIEPKIEYKHNNPERHKKSNSSWLNAYYPIEEHCCYLHGDVYYSDNAIKIIVETKVKDTMFFCIRDLHDGRPIGVNPKGREPLAYKVENQKVFRKAIEDLFKMIDEGKFKTDPISWNLYRKINGLELDYKGFGNGIFNTKGDYIAIDDYSTDVDSMGDIEKIEKFIKIIEGGIEMIKVEVKEQFHLGRFNEIKNLVRKQANVKYEEGMLDLGDTFECTQDLAEYLLGKNNFSRAFVDVIEVIPEQKAKTQKFAPKEKQEADVQVKETKKKTTTKKTTKKKEGK